MELSHGSRCSTRGGSEPGTICAKRFHIIVMVVIMAHFDKNRSGFMMMLKIEIAKMQKSQSGKVCLRGTGADPVMGSTRGKTISTKIDGDHDGDEA